MVLGVILVAACGVRADAPLASPARPSASPLTQWIVVEGDTATSVVDAVSGAVLATLPGGLLAPSADLVVSLKPEGAITKVRAVDLNNKQVLDLSLPGSYALPNAYGAAPSGFSPNGKWLVLVARDGPQSHFAIVDVARSALADTIVLSARFSFDAIHNDGSAMYLIEHPVEGKTAYNVRLYDVRAKTLRPEIIFDKAAVAQLDPTLGLMDGTFHVSVAPTQGDWSYGLYMRPNGAPFVHALNVPGHYATCILDLAGSWKPSSMFSMAMADDGRWLYVVDPAGGNVSVIDALTQKVARRATFATRGGGDPRAASAVVSHDGTRLYASGAHGIAMLLTTDLSLRGWLGADLTVRSLAISRDSARLYALVADEVKVIDIASGRVVGQLPSVTGARALHVLAR